MARTIQGITHAWQVSDSPIGSGDAGEVFAVARLDQPELTGVLKKPARVATGGTIQRQANQIEQEAQALVLLDGLPTGKAHPPRLLDQAPEFTRGTSNYFLISETAPGEDLNTMLASTRQTGKPFPRRVIMTVLDALFDMFSRAHQAGVLWNDVKLEHIYWDNASGKVGVIDWGNALFLEHQGQQARPRWEDYQQMVDTLGHFLQSSAPELYTDLGWEEFQGKTLDAALVSTLARRISYQQQVIALQVMEYQSLIRVVIGSEPTLSGLQKIKGYHEILEKIGAPCPHEDVLAYGQSLIESALSTGDTQVSVSTTALVWEIFDESLALPWYLLREYCRHTDILTHPAFPEMAKHTLNARWEEALWLTCRIAQQNPIPNWWRGLAPVIRQQALQTSMPSPYQACQSLCQWAGEHHQRDLHKQLDHILVTWRNKGVDEPGSPFEYELLDLVRDHQELPHRLRSEIKQSFAHGEFVIRELINAWHNINWEALTAAFRRVISWDPDRWGVLQLSQQVQELRGWLTTLHDGPGAEDNIRTFLELHLADRPKIEHALGTPPWLNALMAMFNGILQGDPIASHHDQVRHYCPWLLPFPDIYATEFTPPDIDEIEQQAMLTGFISNLKESQDFIEALDQIRHRAPFLFPACQRLVEGLRAIFLLNTNLDELEKISPNSDHPELVEGYQVLASLIRWRKQLAEHDLSSAIESLQQLETQAWSLVDTALSISITWHEQILPILKAMQTCSPFENAALASANPQTQLLLHVFQAFHETKQLFTKIYVSGIYENLLEALQETMNTARASFLNWRVAQESAADHAVRLVYLHHLDDVRQVSTSLLRMTQHIYQAKFSFALLGEDQHTSYTLQTKQIASILYHLAAIEAELEPNPARHRFPGYQTTFKNITEAESIQARQALTEALTKEHPFYAWLVKSTLA